MPIIEERYTHNNIEIRVSLQKDEAHPHDPSEIDDIEFKLTSQDRYNALQMLFDKRISAPRAPYTYIFQSYLAKAKGNLTPAENSHELTTLLSSLHHLSALFIPFEAQLQQPHTLQTLIEFKSSAWATYRQQLTETLTNIRSSFESNARVVKQLEQLQAKLDQQCKLFEKNLDTLILQTPTAEDLQCLMSVQNRSQFVPSLGHFMAEQMSAMLDTGIRVAYTCRNRRLRDLIQVPSYIAALSDAKRMIFRKAFALHGAEYNDTHAPIPESMLDSLTDPNNAGTLDEPKWFSIKPYVSSWTPQTIDHITCKLTNDSYESGTKPSLWFDLLKFMASILETVIMIPLRLPVTLLLTAWDVSFSWIGTVTDWSWFKKKPEDKWTYAIDEALSAFHDRWSPVKAAKLAWNERYVRNDPDSDHQSMLKHSMAEHSAFYYLFRHYNPQFLADKVRSFFQTMWTATKGIPTDITYLFGVADSPETAFEKLTTSYQTLPEPATPNQPVDDTYAIPALCETNDISSPLEVIRDIMITLTEVAVDPTFRKSPAAATAFFGLSIVTLGTYYAPQTTYKHLDNVIQFLKSVTDELSRHFTGTCPDSLPTEMIACFLEWEIGFYSVELLLEIQKGQYEILAELFHEPEKISLGVIGLTLMGMSIQYLPTLPAHINLSHGYKLPNIYAQAINVFIEESRNCAKGTFPYTALELFFLGLKFALLADSMLTGTQNKLSSRVAEEANAVDGADDDDEAEDVGLAGGAVLAGQPVPAAATKTSALAKAHQAVAQALNMLGDPRTRQFITTSSQARALYEHLDSLLSQYNDALFRVGRSDLCLPKDDLLHAFYNQYVYQGSNNLLRMLCIFPFYPVTLLWRGSKLAVASLTNKPAIAQQVKKSFYKDLVLVYQVLGMAASMVGAFARAFSYAFRGILGLAAGLIIPVPYVLYRAVTWLTGTPAASFQTWWNHIDDALCHIALHRIRTPQFIRAHYAHISREAGTNSDLPEACRQVEQRLDTARDILETPEVDARKTHNYNPGSTTERLLERFDCAAQVIDAEQATVIMKFQQEAQRSWWVPSTMTSLFHSVAPSGSADPAAAATAEKDM